VLVVDDEPANLASIEKIFQRDGMRVLTADGAKAALEVCRTHRVQVVLTDLMMPGISGLELLRAIKQLSPDTEVVMMTAYGTVETAVQAMREGAYDFVEKPLKRMTIVKSVRKAAERQSLVAENRSLRNEIKLLTRREIVGSSPALRRVLDVATQAAPSSATVLILGESGTGKELVARFIHDHSSRAKAPFVAVNCSAIPETILEAELFGHERGSFTGAFARRDGRFARAAGGTLFLDEIGELSPSVQVKLLRVLQEGEYEPVGGDTVRADVRIVAATNKDLRVLIQQGLFREDLFFRLNVVPLRLPPLRERAEDIGDLARHFFTQAHSEGLPLKSMESLALDRLKRYKWPGNIRELENLIRRLAALYPQEVISEQIVIAELGLESSRENPRPTPPSGSASLSALQVNGDESLGMSVERHLAELFKAHGDNLPPPGLYHRILREIEYPLISIALAATRGNQIKAAELLGLNRNTLRKKVRDLDVRLMRTTR